MFNSKQFHINRSGGQQVMSSTTTFDQALLVVITSVFLFLAGAVMLVSGPAHAAPEMQIIETPIEGTSVIRLRVNKKGSGTAVLGCVECPRGRVRLDVTPATTVTKNGKTLPISQYSPGSNEFITAFYKADTGVLTRLLVEEMN